MKNRTPTREKSATISTRPKLEAGEGYIYGRRPVMEILRRRPEALRQIYYRLGSSFLEDLSAIHYKAGKTHFTTRAVSEEELDSWTDGGNHQGLFAVFLERPESTLEAIVEASLSPSGAGTILAVDEVVDPQNLGSIFRLADAAGIDGILSTERRSAQVSAAVRRASAGASEFVPFSTVKNLHRTITMLKDTQFWIVGTAAGDASRNLFTVSVPKPRVLVFGSEGKGLRDLTAKSCDMLVRIPMNGNADSLNVSQAAAVVIYETLRQDGGLTKN